MGPQHLIAKSADSMGEQVLGRGLMARGFLRKSNLFAIHLDQKMQAKSDVFPQNWEQMLNKEHVFCGISGPSFFGNLLIYFL